MGKTLSAISVNGLMAAGDKRIIGVAGDTKANDLSQAAAPEIYLPYDQSPLPYLTVVVRSSLDPNAVLTDGRRIVTALDRAVPITHATTLDDAIGASVAQPRLEVGIVDDRSRRLRFSSR